MENKDDGRSEHPDEHRTPFNPSSPRYSPLMFPGPHPLVGVYSPTSPQYIPYSPVAPQFIPYSLVSPGYVPQGYSPTQHIELPSYMDDDGDDEIVSNTQTPLSFNPSRKIRESIKNQTDVALGITKQLLLTLGKDKNMVYSPLSINIGLGMIMAGTKGHVLDRFLSFLKCESITELNDLASNVYPLVFADGQSKGGPHISFANGAWVEESLHVKPCFKEALDASYEAALNHVNFRTRAEQVRCEANAWVDKKTKGLIKDILSSGSVSSETDLILANALYFKGAWTIKFDESRTKDYDFHLQSGSTVKAPFMTSHRKQYIDVFDSFKVLKLEYRHGKDYGRRFCMYVFLPNAKDGLQALVDRVCSESIDQYIPCKSVPVGKFLIPKFKISTEIDPLRILKSLGLSLEKGYLTEMVEGRAISPNMLQKAFVEVNEEGTEAAAAVYIACSPSYSSGSRPEPILVDFVADHPFLYLIREEVTGTILFVGHVLNPTKEK